MQKRITLLFSLLIFISSYCQSNDNHLITGYLDNDNLLDTIYYSIKNELITGKILTSTIKLKFNYAFDEPLETNIDIPEKGCIAFMTSGNGMSSNQKIEFYDFDENYQTWIHTKSIEISNNINYGIEIPNIEFSYYNNDFETLDEKLIKYHVRKPKKNVINNLISDCKIHKINIYKIIEYLANFEINSENVVNYNDLAFFTQKESISLFILHKILMKFPKRAVAVLNLGDSYYYLGNSAKAILNYKKYIHLMKEQKKDLKKIPQYVYERIKE